MPINCIVKTCTNYYSYTNRKYVTNGVKMYKLPTDLVERNKWKKLAGLDKNYELTNSSKICEEHFSEDALHGFKCRVLGTNIGGQCKCAIQEGHFPTLKLPEKSMEKVEEELYRIARKERKSNHKIVEELLLNPSGVTADSQSILDSSASVNCIVVDSVYQEDEELQVFSEDSESKSDAVQQEFEPSVFGLEDLCRVCALAATDMVGIFTTEGLHDKISLCLPVKMEEGDQLPAQVCHSCLKRINESYELRNISLNSEVVLKGMLQQQTLFEDCQPADTNDSPLENQSPADPHQSEPNSTIVYEAFDLGDQDQFETNLYDNVAVTYELPSENTAVVFLCEYCVKLFNSKEELEEHMNEGHKFFCTLCNLTLIGIDKNTLSNHYKALHPNDYNLNKKINYFSSNIPNYECKICLKTYLSRNILKNHYKQCHSQLLCYDIDCYNFYQTEEDVNTHCINIHEKSVHDYKNTCYDCKHCDKKYKSKKQLQSHIYYIHEGNEGKYVCNICNKKYRFSNALHHHEIVHHNKSEKNYQCQECNKLFPALTALKVHQQMHVKEKKFACKICDKVFKTSRHLKQHSDHVHIENWSFSCSICGIAFTNEKDITVHYNNHSDDEKINNASEKIYLKTSPYQCQKCLKFYSNNFKLHMHNKNTHNTIKGISKNNKQYQCHICSKLLNCKMSLKTHLSIHLSIKPYACKYCDKTCCTKGNLIIHERIHTNENPFKCNLCEKSFRSKLYLYTHIKQTHEKIRNFECNFCQKKFFREYHMKVHIRTHTKEKPYMCNICPQRFTQRGDMRRHIARHVEKLT